MIERRSFLKTMGAGLSAATLAKWDRTGLLAQPGKGLYSVPVGLEIYSLRREMNKDVPGTLDMIRRMGFAEVEVPGYYGLSVREFRQALDRAGLAATALVAPHERLTGDLPGTISDAKILGATYLVYPWIPHQGPFTSQMCAEAIGNMNRWGRQFKAAGLRFTYHPHGYEFGPGKAGTLFDDMVAGTEPGIADFELDTYWMAWPGQDPLHFLKKYASRFPLVHLKDLKKGVKGNQEGHAPDETSVPVGSGSIDFTAFLAHAKKVGVKRYYIEDEAETAATQIPQSLQFLRSIKM